MSASACINAAFERSATFSVTVKPPVAASGPTVAEVKSTADSFIVGGSGGTTPGAVTE